MIITPLALPGVFIIRPQLIRDTRGYFYEGFHRAHMEKVLKKTIDFVQENTSYSIQNVIRGLHYQYQTPQAKLIRVISGVIWDVVVDVRPSSPTFGKHIHYTLSQNNRHQIWIPEGCAHGFAVLSPFAEITYKVTTYWNPEAEQCIRWDDKTLAIPWPIHHPPYVSEKDAQGISFENARYH